MPQDSPTRITSPRRGRPWRWRDLGRLGSSLRGTHHGAGRFRLRVRRSLPSWPRRVAGGIARELVEYRSAFVALVLAAAASLVAGLTLASVTDTLERLPGLLLLVPAAIAVKGNIFGALGSRLGTAIHAGTFTLSRGRDSVVTQNTTAAMALSLVLGVVLALLAKIVALAFNVSPTMSTADFVVVSTAGGLVASVFVLIITLATTAGSVRFGWDLDNVVAPLVTASADVVTLPALVLAVELTGTRVLTPALSWSLVAASVVTLAWVWRSSLTDLRRIARESVPILAVAGLVDLVAGITVEKRLDDFLRFPVLLVLLPGYLGTAGALGGVLSSRLSTKLHLGLARTSAVPHGPARVDLVMIYGLAIPVFAALGLMTAGVGELAGVAGPGFSGVLGVALIGGLMATALVSVVAYYGTLAAVRFGLDPDTYGVPVVTSSLDFVGAFTFIWAVLLVGFR